MTTGSSSHTHSTTTLDDAIGAESNTRLAADVALGKRIDAAEARLLALEAPVVPPVVPPVTPPTVTPSAPITVKPTDDGLIIADKAFTGQPATGYGIWAVGTASNHIHDLVIRRCTFTGFEGAIWAGFVDNILIEDCTIDGAHYSGIMVLSAVGGTIRRNTVRNIGVGGTIGTDNAYGIAISQQNPATDPVSVDTVVSDNLVDNVPVWHGLDTHSGLRIQFLRNTVKRSRHGLFITGSSSKRATDCLAQSNRFEAPVGADQYAMVSVYSTGGTLKDNTVQGWPAGHEVLTTSSGDPAATAVGLTVSGTVVL